MTTFAIHCSCLSVSPPAPRSESTAPRLRQAAQPGRSLSWCSKCDGFLSAAGHGCELNSPAALRKPSKLERGMGVVYVGSPLRAFSWRSSKFALGYPSPHIWLRTAAARAHPCLRASHSEPLPTTGRGQSSPARPAASATPSPPKPPGAAATLSSWRATRGRSRPSPRVTATAPHAQHMPFIPPPRRAAPLRLPTSQRPSSGSTARRRRCLLSTAPAPQRHHQPHQP